MSWPVGTVSELAEVISGYAFKSTWFGEGSSKVIRIGDLKNGRIDVENAACFDEKANPVKEQFKIREGDILMALSGATVGKIAVATADTVGCYLNQRVAIVRSKSPESADYLKYVFSGSYLDKLLLSAGGAAQPNLSPKDLASMEIPLAPLDKQKRIAAILDKADSVRRKRQQAIALADDFLRSVFLELFGDPVTNPKGWEVKLLAEHIQHANNGLSRRRKIEENVGNIVLRLQDVHYEGIRFGKELNRIELEDKEKSRYRLDIGDLLFIRVNGNPEYVGRSAVFEGFKEAVFHNDHLIRIKVEDSYNTRFLSYMLNLPAGKRIISSKTKTSAGQHTISQEGIESLEFIVPPIDLQSKFVEIQSAVKKQLIRQSVSLNELIHNFNSLSQKAFSGEL